MAFRTVSIYANDLSIDHSFYRNHIKLAQHAKKYTLYTLLWMILGAKFNFSFFSKHTTDEVWVKCFKYVIQWRTGEMSSYRHIISLANGRKSSISPIFCGTKEMRNRPITFQSLSSRIEFHLDYRAKSIQHVRTESLIVEFCW